MSRTVHAACPHDCPDTCAMQVTVQDGRVVRIQGDPDHPHDPRRAVHQGLALCRAQLPRRARAASAEARRPQGQRPLRAVGWDEALDDIAARLQAIAARDPQAIVPYSYAGTMGLVQGESMAARFFHKLGASLLDRTICSRAGGEALAATYGAKVGMHMRALRREPADPDLGQQLDRQQPALLDLRAAGQARRRQAGVHRPAAHRDGRQVPPAHRAAARHRRRAGARRDARADRQRLARPRLHRAPCRRLAALRERALQWPPERAAAVCGITADEVRGLARDYGTTQPAAIRLNYGMQRVRGGGNAARLIALLPCLIGAWRHRAGGLLLSSSGWFAPFRNPALQRPDLLAGRQPAHHQHEHHRRRPAARGLARLRAEDRGAGRLQQQPGGGGARSRPRWSPASRARTCSPWCSSTS